MSDDNVSIVLPRQHAQSLYNMLDRATVQGLKAKQDVVFLMATIGAALAVKPEASDGA